MTEEIHFEETRYGFEFGDVKISRVAEDERRGSVVLQLTTSTYNHKNKEKKAIQIYVTKTGRIRIYTIRDSKKGSKSIEWSENEDERRIGRVRIKGKKSNRPYV